MNVSNKSASRRSIFRLLVRCACLLATVALALPLVSWPRAPQLLPALSPFMALGSLLSRHSLTLVLPAVLLTTGLALLRKRWICQWLCPVGLLNDQAGRLRPSARGRFVRWPLIGHWLALLTLGGAALGYPLFLWLDPFSIFNGAVGAWRRPIAAAWLPLAALGAALLLSALWPNSYCLRVCPLGSFQELMFIPRQWLERLTKKRPPAPLRIQSSSPAPRPSGMPLARRALIALGLGGAWALATRRAVGSGDLDDQPILPPGAVERRAFSGLCVRCGNCSRACPQRIIKPSLGQHGLAALLMPTLSFEQEYCHPDCVACTRVCPSGSLQLVSLAQKRTTVLGLAKVTVTDCLQVTSGDCNECSAACYFDAIHPGVLRDGDIAPAPAVDPKRCVGCGACEMVCPARPKAIVVRPIA